MNDAHTHTHTHTNEPKKRSERKKTGKAEEPKRKKRKGETAKCLALGRRECARIDVAYSMRRAHRSATIYTSERNNMS